MREEPPYTENPWIRGEKMVDNLFKCLSEVRKGFCDWLKKCEDKGKEVLRIRKGENNDS